MSAEYDIENTKESILSVCDKPYHKIKENMPLGKELENLWNYPFSSIYKSSNCSTLDINQLNLLSSTIFQTPNISKAKQFNLKNHTDTLVCQ